MKRKTLAVIILVLFITSITAGCGGNTGKNEGTTSAVSTSTQQESTVEQTTVAGPDYGDTGGLALPISKEKITLKLMTWTYPETPQPDNFFTQELEKRTNIKVELERYPADDPTEKLTILASSNSLPDLIGYTNNSLITKLGSKLFVPINQHLDIMPNYKKILNQYPGIMQSYTLPDNNLYVFDYNASEMGAKGGDYGYAIRNDILKKNNLNMPTNSEEYYQLFKALKKIYPESYPYVSYYGPDILLKIAPSFGTYDRMFLPDGVDSWEFGPVTENYKNMLQYLAKLYSEGLMDPEFMVAGEERFSSLILQEDKAFLFNCWFGRMDTLTNTAKEKIKDYELVGANPLGTYGKEMPDQPVYDWGMSVASSSKHIEEALKLVDYWYSPSGATLNSMGVEGTTFKVGADGKIEYPGFEGQTVTRVELEKKYGLCLTLVLSIPDPRSTLVAKSPSYQAARDLLKGKWWSGPQPVLKLTEEENATKAEKEAALVKEVQAYSTKVIMGKESLNNWDAWVKKCEKLGCKDLEKLYNDAYARIK